MAEKQVQQPPNPDRFAAFQELYSNEGNLIGFILDTGEEFRFDEYQGWYDEFGNYYNKDGQPCSPPQEKAKQQATEEENKTNITTTQQELDTSNNKQENQQQKKKEEDEEVKLGENQDDLEEGCYDDNIDDYDLDDEDYREPDPERFNSYEQIFDEDGKLIGFALLTGEEFYYDEYQGWYDEYGNYYDKSGYPAEPYSEDEDDLINLYVDDDEDDNEPGYDEEEKQIKAMIYLEQMKETIQNYSNEHKVVIEMKNLDFNATIKDVQQFFVEDLDQKILESFEVEIDGDKSSKGRIYVNDKNLALKFIQNDKKQMKIQNDHQREQRKIYLSVQTMDELVQDRFDLNNLKIGVKTLTKQQSQNSVTSSLNSEAKQKIEEVMSERKQKYEHKQQQQQQQQQQAQPEGPQKKTQEQIIKEMQQAKYQKQQQQQQSQPVLQQQQQKTQEQMQPQEQSQPVEKQKKTQEQIMKELQEGKYKNKK